MALKVLAVDDDRMITRLVKMNLDSPNIRVTEAGNGLDCIRTICENDVDLLLLDLRLPDFSGWGILSLLRMTNSLNHIPVILISVEPPDAALIRQLKPDDYIQKPFDVRDLVTRVRKVIGQKAQEGDHK